ncbi:MAG: alpha/beta fold hydrolase [Myxococcota bacterium]
MKGGRPFGTRGVLSPDPWPEPQTVRLGAFRVAYRQTHPHADTAALLVHGLGASGHSWVRCWESVANVGAPRRVVVPDLPGFGNSDKRRYRYTIPFWSERLLRLLDHLELDRADFVGHSMGAHISLWTALHHPSRVRRLVLVSPAGIERFNLAQRKILQASITPGWVRRQSRRQVRSQVELAFHRMPPEARWIVDRRLALQGPELEGYAYAFSAGVKAMLAAPVIDRLGEIRKRTLVVMGANDALVPNRLFRPQGSAEYVASRAAGSIPGARLVMLPRTGHLVPFERPAELTDHVTKFLDR